VSVPDDVLSGGPGKPVPAVVDVTDRALARARAAVPPGGPQRLTGRAADPEILAGAAPGTGGDADPVLRVQLDDPRLTALPRGSTAIRRRLLLTTLLAADAAGLAAGWAVPALAPDPRWHAVPPGAGAGLLLALAVPAWWAAIAGSGGYPARRRVASAASAGRFVAGALRFSAAALLVTALAWPDAARGVALAAPGALAAALLLRLLAERAVRAVLRWGRRRVLVVGSAPATASLLTRLSVARPPGLQVVGHCSWQRPGAAEVLRRRVAAAARASRAELVLVADPGALGEDGVRRLAWSLEGTGLGLLVATGLAGVAPARLQVQVAAGVPLLALDEPVLTGAPRVLKEVADRLGAAVLLLVLSPLLVLVAAGVTLADPGPAFFRQERVGRHGERFSMVRFRSLRVDAERWRPRVTTVGRLLRRSSLDELPQLINVLRGEMSLVGPRPPLPAEVECYQPEALRRLRVKPGITGLWQVSGRAGLDRRESVRLDLSYVDNWSAGLDARILCRTPFAVLSGRGAR
jgi:exopolysaccharide biosynthesis polyprenyl glycosylphosphotransferase